MLVEARDLSAGVRLLTMNRPPANAISAEFDQACGREPLSFEPRQYSSEEGQIVGPLLDHRKDSPDRLAPPTCQRAGHQKRQ